MVCSDYYRIAMEKDHHGTAVAVRMSGTRPRPPRGAMGSTLQSGSRALLFGGVHDEEYDGGETVMGHFYNDLYVVELDKARWHLFNYATEQKAVGTENTSIPSQSGAGPTSDLCTSVSTSQLSNGVFTLTLQNTPLTCGASAQPNATGDFDRSPPSPRSSPGIAVLNSTLYVYGGVYEVGDRKITLDDFYCLDLNRPISWTCLYGGTQSEQEWFGSDLEESEEEDDESGDSEVETAAATRSHNMEVDSDSSADDDEELVEDAPAPLSEESASVYWSRTADFWCSLVNRGLEQDRSSNETPSFIGCSNLAERLAQNFYARHTRNPI